MLAAAVEVGSHHPLAQAIIQRAIEYGADLPLAQARRALAGVGVEGLVGGKTVLISAQGKLELLGGKWQSRVENLESAGKTVVVVAEDGVPIGLPGVTRYAAQRCQTGDRRAECVGSLRCDTDR